VLEEKLLEPTEGERRNSRQEKLDGMVQMFTVRSASSAGQFWEFISGKILEQLINL
jgi:phage head maturation protease